MLKNNTFLDSIFEWIFFLASEKNGKIEQCSYFYRKHQFCKNHCFLEGKLLIFWFGALKNPPKLDAQTQRKITSKKKASKIEFGSPFGPPKSSKINLKISKAMWNEACFAMLWEYCGTRRKLIGPKACKASKWLHI